MMGIRFRVSALFALSFIFWQFSGAAEAQDSPYFIVGKISEDGATLDAPGSRENPFLFGIADPENPGAFKLVNWRPYIPGDAGARKPLKGVLEFRGNMIFLTPADYPHLKLPIGEFAEVPRVVKITETVQNTHKDGSTSTAEKITTWSVRNFTPAVDGPVSLTGDEEMHPGELPRVGVVQDISKLISTCQSALDAASRTQVATPATKVVRAPKSSPITSSAVVRRTATDVTPTSSK